MLLEENLIAFPIKLLKICCNRISSPMKKKRDAVIDLYGQGVALFFCLGFQQFCEFADRVVEMKWGIHQDKFSGFNFGEIQNIINDI